MCQTLLALAQVDKRRQKTIVLKTNIQIRLVASSLQIPACPDSSCRQHGHRWPDYQRTICPVMYLPVGWTRPGHLSLDSAHLDKCGPTHITAERWSWHMHQTQPISLHKPLIKNVQTVKQRPAPNRGEKPVSTGVIRQNSHGETERAFQKSEISI